MVERQLRRRGIEDERVLEAMSRVPRERFVPAPQRRRSYADAALPIGDGQTISQPLMVALILAAMELNGAERVLEVGTGSGYSAALLSLLAREVFSVERHGELAAQAAALLAELGHTNVRVIEGDGSAGLPEHSPYDAIAVHASAPAPPPALMSELADGGRLVVPVAGPGADMLVRLRRRGQRFEPESLGPCRFVPLVGEAGFSPGDENS